MREYEATAFANSELTEDVALALHERHSEKVTVEWPTPATNRKWRLTSRGWAGYLPVADSHLVELAPRVPLASLFGMLEYAYDLKSFQVLHGSTECSTLAEFYERFAAILARRALERSRRGLHRAYVGALEDLSCVRGRVDVPQLVRAPWRPAVPCQFEEHTANVPENAILLWTLDRILRSGLCTDRALPLVRAAHRRLGGSASLQPFTAADCRDRAYSRLNSDYAPMHWLCRFFLENSGPAHDHGDQKTLPFLVHMPGLFEAFVASWLARHAAGRFRVERQFRLDLPGSAELKMVVDIVLRDPVTDRVVAVLDTKYKLDQTPSAADAAQVVAYAQALGCRTALLVYPIAVGSQRAEFGDITVSSVMFELGRPLGEGGQAFLDSVACAIGAGGPA